jgi:hypothetical protein
MFKASFFQITSYSMSRTTAKHEKQSRSRRVRIRRGAIWLAFLMIMLIVIASLTLAVNWSYGLVLQRHQQRLCDLLSLGAMEHLLDESLLEDAPLIDAATNQSDDILQAQTALLDPNNGLLALNNAVSANAFRPDASELEIKIGRVDNALLSPQTELTPGVFNFSMNGTGELYNTVWVDIRRGPASMRKAFPLISGIVRDSDYALTLSAGAFASLDSRVVGLRPYESSAYSADNKTAPIMPLAIQRNAWFTTRPGLADSNGNNRTELWIELKNVPADVANGALINFDATLPLTQTNIPSQIQNGITSSDLTTGMFGPVHTQVTYAVQATENSPSNLAAVENAILTIIGTNKAKKVFPIFNTFSSTLQIEGLIAAEVLDVDTTTSRLRVLVEPAFLIHSTLITQREITDSFSVTHTVPENIYLHKIRLTQ